MNESMSKGKGKGKGGGNRSTSRGDRRRGNLTRGLSAETLARVRPLGSPAVGFDETSPVTVVMALPYAEEGEEERAEAAAEEHGK